MRILTLTQFYPPIIGGEEEHTHALSHALARRGHDVAVATLWHKGQPAFEVEEDGVRVYRLRSTVGRLTGLFASGERRYAPPTPDPEALLALRGILARERPQIVHAHNWLARSFLPLKAWSGARLVMTLHNYSLSCARNTLLRDDGLCVGPGPLKCLACAPGQYGLAKGVVTTLGNLAFSPLERRQVDAFIAVSDAVAVGNRLAQGLAPFHVIPTLIPDDAYQSAEQDDAALQPSLAQLPTRPFILFVGALGRYKGAEVVLRAHAALGDAAAPLVMIGHPKSDFTPPTPETHPNVVVLRSWPRKAVLAAWRRCLFGVIPSLWADPCPTVTLEAMAAGKPVIASRIGGLPDEVVEGVTGLLTTAGDVDALRDAMRLLLSDATLRERMGAAGLQRVRLYLASVIAERVERVFDDALRRPAYAASTPFPVRTAP